MARGLLCRQSNSTMNMTRNLKSVALAIAGVILLPSCASVGNANTRKNLSGIDPEYEVKAVEHGKASWYSIRTNYGTKTASGQRLCNHGATAAHKTLPMGTKVRVTNLSNGKSEVVTINDRGPYSGGRILDVQPTSLHQRTGLIIGAQADVALAERFVAEHG